MSISGQAQQIEELLTRTLHAQDPDAQIRVKPTSLGWIHLKIITSLFNDQEEIERERRIDTILEEIQLNLGDYPFSRYDLFTPQQAPPEAMDQPPFYIPLWSDVLMAPDPDHPVPLDQDITRHPLTVTFYSFKGGVGRSTALGLVANILATRGYRVVMIDFDLEAPGLSFLFPAEKADAAKYGVLDYIHQRFLTPDENIPEIAECIRQIELPVRGELYLVPSGEYDENYVHRLADFDVHLLYQQEKNPIHQLVDDVKEYLDPDIILIDARTGLTDIGAVALLEQADLGIVCFAPTKQSFAGLQWVVNAVKKQRSYRGSPDLRFILTPMPVVAASQQQMWLAHTAEWISTHWTLPPFVTVDELYHEIPYNSNITTLNSLADEMPAGMLEPYSPIADDISASLPARESALPDLIDYQQEILSQLHFQTRAAQELTIQEIATTFQRTGGFAKLLPNRTWFITGAKGAGKTLLFRLFTELPEEARRLAAQEDLYLDDVQFIPGHGPTTLRRTLLTGDDMIDYAQQTGLADSDWRQFWLNYTLLQLVTAFPELTLQTDLDSQLAAFSQKKTLQRSEVISWLVTCATIPLSLREKELHLIDQWLQQQKKRVWIFYDDIDGLEQNYEAHRPIADGLLYLWRRIRVKSIIPKIFLREGLASSAFLFSPSSRTLRLRWGEEDIWRLVLHQALSTSSTLTNLINRELKVSIDDLDSLEKERLQQCLYLLWSERVDRGNKIYTDSWLWRNLSDGNDDHFPRTILQLLQYAVDIEKTTPKKDASRSILCTQSLIDAQSFASQQRVVEVLDDEPGLASLLTKLSGHCSPLSFDHLMNIWNTSGENTRFSVIRLESNGIFREQPRYSEHRERFYTVPELYLSGLGMHHCKPH